MNYLFFEHFARDSFFNMAFDEWLLNKSVEYESCFFLRLYSWSPGGITIGVNQNEHKAIDYRNLKTTPVIRRITGGRAIFHDESELTYSLVVKNNQISDSTKLNTLNLNITQALMRFLKKLGIESNFVKISSRSNSMKDYFHKAPCFNSFAKYEITSKSKKIIASAQRKFDNVILQHGSIKLNGVIKHPALDHETDNSVESQQVTSGDFVGAVQGIREAFEEQFVVSFASQTMRPEIEEEVRLVEKIIRKNPYFKRKTFKQ